FSRSFDERGQVEQQRTFDGSIMQRSGEAVDGRTISVTAGGTTERWTYDERGRVVEHERPGDRVLRYRYDRDSLLPSGVSGPLGLSVRHEWSNGLPVSVTDADGVAVRFEHDRDGNVIATVDALGQRTAYEWHPTGRPSVVRHPDGAEQRMVWDDGGRLVA